MEDWPHAHRGSGRRHRRRPFPARSAARRPRRQITVIGNTGDDINLFGLRVCPDLDTVMYTLGGGINEEQGWGRADETFTSSRRSSRRTASSPQWFGLGDRDFATHIVRTQMLDAGYPLSAVTEALCARWQPGVRLLPMTDDRVETHVVIEDDAGQAGRPLPGVVGAAARLGRRPRRSSPVGADAGQARARACWRPSPTPTSSSCRRPTRWSASARSWRCPASARRSRRKTVVGVSPIVGGAPGARHGRRCLPRSASRPRPRRSPALYGSGLLDGWLVADEDAVRSPLDGRPRSAARPAADDRPRGRPRAMARAALDLAEELRP